VIQRDETIKKYSESELDALREQGEGRTDLARVRAKAEVELEHDIASDPDFRDVPETWDETAEAVVPVPKKLLSPPRKRPRPC